MVKAKQIDLVQIMRIIATVLVAGAALVWMAQAPAIAQNTTQNADIWQVTEAEGRVWINHGDEGWRALGQGARLAPGDRIETGMNGHIKLSQPGKSLTVWPNSRFRLPAPGHIGPTAHIMHTLGTLQFSISGRDRQAFKVRTPYLTAASSNTAFTISVDVKRASLHVTGGALQVTSTLSGETAVLKSGYSTFVDRSDGGRMEPVSAGMRNKLDFGSAPKTGPKFDRTPVRQNRTPPHPQAKGGEALAQLVFDALNKSVHAKFAGLLPTAKRPIN